MFFLYLKEGLERISCFLLSRLDVIMSEVDQTARAKNQLQLVTQQLTTELRTIEARNDTQAIEVAAASKELRNKTQRLEQENNQMVNTCLES